MAWQIDHAITDTLGFAKVILFFWCDKLYTEQEGADIVFFDHFIFSLFFLKFLFFKKVLYHSVAAKAFSLYILLSYSLINIS